MSTLKSIRTLLENQIDSGETDPATDPTSTILDIYINEAIRNITRKDRPRELQLATVFSANIVINQNTVALPATVFMPDLVYFENSSGTVVELVQKPLKQMIDIEGSNRFFDTNNTGNPSLYDVRGTSLLFNKYFSRTATAAIKIYGLSFPAALVSATETSDLTELPSDYDLLMVYESAILFYQKDDDLENQQKFQSLAFNLRADLRIALRTNDSDSVQLDPYTFGGDSRSAKNDPDIFFGS